MVSPQHTPHSEEGPCYPHLTDEETEALTKVTRLTRGGGGFKSRLSDTPPLTLHPPTPLPWHTLPQSLQRASPSSVIRIPISTPDSPGTQLLCLLPCLLPLQSLPSPLLRSFLGPGPLRASRLGWARSPVASSHHSLPTSLQRVEHAICPPHTGGHGTLLPLASPSLVSPLPPPGSFLGDSPVPTSSLLCAHLPPQLLLTPHTPLLGHQLPSLLAQVSLLSSSLPPCSPLGKVTGPRHPPMPQLSLLSYPLPQGCRGSLFPHDWSGCISLPFTSLVNAFSLRKSIFSLMKYCVSCRDVLVKRHHKEAEKQISQCVSTRCKPS